MTVDTAKFHWVDYIVFVLNLLISAGIGLYHGFGGKKKQDTKDFLVGGRNMSPVPVALSILASFLSAPFLLGIPVEIYLFGTVYCYAYVGQFLACITTNYFFLPVYHRLELTSAYEYLELRFNRKVRVLGSSVFCIKMMLFMAVIIYAPSVSFAEVTGLQTWVTILVTGLVCTFYTSVGGMKAVIWADVVQMIIIMACSLILVILGCNAAGGYINVLYTAQENGRIILDDFNPDPSVRHTFWTQTIGLLFGINAILASNQVTIQRCMSIEKLEDVQRCLWLCLLAVGFCNVMIFTLGLVIYAVYSHCDPITTGMISSKDQLVPMFVMDMLGHLKGMPGLFAASVFSATLSTVSSGLNALAAVILIDMIKPAYYNKYNQVLNEQVATKISKALAAVIGLITIGLAYLAPFLGPTILYLSLALFGIVGGPLLGLFSLAIFFPTCNPKGAIVGLITSLVFSIWIAVGRILYPNSIAPLPLHTDGCPTTPPMNSSIYDSPYMHNMYTNPSYFSTSSPFMDFDTTTTMPPSTEYKGLALYKVSYAWLAFIAWLTAVIVGVIVSAFTGGNKDREIDPKLMFPYKERINYFKKLYYKIRGKEYQDDDDNDSLKKKVSSNPEEAHLLQEMVQMTPVMPVRIGYKSDSNGVVIDHIRDISTYQIKDDPPRQPMNTVDQFKNIHRLHDTDFQSFDSDYDNVHGVQPGPSMRQSPRPYQYLQSNVRDRFPKADAPYVNNYIEPQSQQQQIQPQIQPPPPPPPSQSQQGIQPPTDAQQPPQQPQHAPPQQQQRLPEEQREIDQLKEKSEALEQKLEQIQMLLQSQQELLMKKSSRFSHPTGAKRIDPTDPNWLNN